MFLNVGAKPTDPWIPLEVAQVARKHFKLQNTIHWVKSIAIDRAATGSGSRLDRDVAVGHYKPINSDRFVNDCHEYIFHFSPGGRNKLDRRAVGVPYQDPSNIARWAKSGDGLRCRGNTWFIPYETIQSRDRDRPHPASFPPKVPEQCVRLHGLDRARRGAGSVSRTRDAARSPPPGWAWTSSGSKWTSTTWRKRSRA